MKSTAGLAATVGLGAALALGAEPALGQTPPAAVPLGAEPAFAQTPPAAGPLGAEPVGVPPVGVGPVGAEPVGVPPVGAGPVGAGPPSAVQVSAEAAPAPPRISASLDLEWMQVRDGAYRLFSNADTLSAGGVSATYEILRPHPRVGLAVGLGLLDADEQNHPWGGGGQWASLDLDSYYATAVATYRIWSWLRPYVTVSAGGTHGSVRLTFMEGTALEDTGFWRWSAFARAAAGLRLATNPLKLASVGRSVVFTAAGEYGFQVGTPLSFAPEPPDPDDEKLKEDRIPATGASLGALGRNYPFWRFKIGVEF